MPANEYYFVSHWRVPCTPQEAYDILKDRNNLANWWPSGFLEAKSHTFEDGAEGVAVATQGWLPYVLRFTMRELASDPPGSLVIEARGDLNGRGIWTLVPDGEWTNITYDWRVSADKPIVKLLSPVLKPLFQVQPRLDHEQGREEPAPGAHAPPSGLRSSP